MPQGAISVVRITFLSVDLICVMFVSCKACIVILFGGPIVPVHGRRHVNADIPWNRLLTG